jgi:glucosamine--fructose-6-phosphate aminotransferase (isomerizing)
MGEYTIQEIRSQAGLWRHMLERKGGPLVGLDAYALEGPVLFTGCGSSYYASLAAAAAWTRFAGGPAFALSATDILMYPECHFSREMRGTVVAVSRSGKTPETRAAACHLRETLGWKAIGVSCHDGSAVLNACDAGIVLAEATERSRFTTRVFTGTVLAALLWAGRHGGHEELERELTRLPDLAQKLLARYEAPIEQFARAGKFEQYIYLGHGPYFGLASEAMLKTKEMAGTPAEVYHSLELLHGPKYAVNPSTLIVILLSDGGRERQLELLPKIKAFGAQVLAICEEAAPEIREHTDWVWELHSGLSDYGRMLLMMPLLQLFAYYRALALGKTVD